MAYEQLNFHETKEFILKEKVDNFIIEKEKERAINKRVELGGIAFQQLAEELSEEVEGKDLVFIKKVLGEKLLKKGYQLSRGVITADIKGEDGPWLEYKNKKEKAKKVVETDQTSITYTKEEIREMRNKAPGPFKGMPSGDF